METLRPFSSLISYIGNEEKFFSDYPTPVLLLQPADKAYTDLVDTPSVSTERTVSVKFDGVIFVEKRPELLYVRVASLKKSDRNPFKSMITLGRAKNNDIIILDKQVSKVHAIFSGDGESWFIEDRGGVNGTTLCGIALKAKDSYPLQDKDELLFGGTVLAQFLEATTLWKLLQSWET